MPPSMPGRFSQFSRPAFFYRSLESAPDASVIVDASGAISLVNGEKEKLFGYKREGILGQPLEILDAGTVSREPPALSRATSCHLLYRRSEQPSFTHLACS